MSILVIVAFLLCPLLALPFIYVGIKKDPKHRVVYLALAAMFVALFSYSYTPTAKEDLYRHHVDTMSYQDADIGDLGKALTSGAEQVTTLYEFMIGKTGNPALLQFFTAAGSFFILFYLLDAFTTQNKDVRGLKLVGIWLFVLAGFYFIVITSNIFYTLALELFSLGVYMDYMRGRKKIGILLYILPVFIHTSAIFMLILILLFKLLKSKISIRNLVILAVLIFSINFLLTTVAANVKLPVISELSNLYNAYFNNEEEWAMLHTAQVLALYLSRMIPVFVGYRLSQRREPMSDFAIFVSIAVIVLFFQTTFSIRYIHVVVLCGLPLIFDAVRHKKYGQAYSAMLYVLAVPHIFYQVRQLISRTDWGGLENIQRILVTNLISTLSGK